VVPDHRREDELEAMIAALRACSRPAITANKRLIYAGIDSDLETTLNREVEVVVELDISDETQDSMAVLRATGASAFSQT
jgi:hypothetical protein